MEWFGFAAIIAVLCLIAFKNGGSSKALSSVKHTGSISSWQAMARETTVAFSRKPVVAENGSYYGELNVNDVPKTVHVNGYYRSDGAYVRGHYRSPPYSNPPYTATTAPRSPPTYTPPSYAIPAAPSFVAQNGSYYSQPNAYGVPKTTYVSGYFRSDGTYVRSHYRSR